MASNRTFGRPIQPSHPKAVVPILAGANNNGIAERKAFGTLTNNHNQTFQQQENRHVVLKSSLVQSSQISSTTTCSSKIITNYQQQQPCCSKTILTTTTRISGVAGNTVPINDENFSFIINISRREPVEPEIPKRFFVFEDDTPSQQTCTNEEKLEREQDDTISEKNVSNMTIDADDDDGGNDQHMDGDQQMNNLYAQKENLQDSSLLECSDISYVLQYTELEILSEYSSSIYLYMLEQERKFMPNPFYMSKQQHVNSKMRSILVDWLIDVADEYKLKDETLFLAINYVDRFLSNYSISRQEFQLLGTAALLIAAKYEEIYPPELCEFVFITDDAFTKDQILVMEKTILQGLSFDVSVPTCNYFLEFYSVKLGLEKQVYCLAKYLMFLSTLEFSPFLKYFPSEIAICSIMLALKIHPVDDEPHSDFIQSTFAYEASLGDQGDVIHLINERNNLMEALNHLRMYAVKHPQQAAQKKFSDSKYYHASKIAEEAII